MKKSFKIILIAGLVIAVMQFFRPPVLKDATPPPDLAGVPVEVNNILRNSCFDCHSAGASLHWYDKITPAGFLVANHIKNGRKAFDFSGWDSLAVPQQNAMLYYALNKALDGEMPLATYTAIHPSAKINAEELQVLKKFAYRRTPLKITDSAEVLKMNEAYIQWLSGKLKPQQVQAAPNGIAYNDGYRQWKAISTTDRFDNNSLRIIFANDVATKAIAEHHTNPWPDGTTFAKAAWKQQVNADSSITTGAFLQVEFMIKNAKKYAATNGWGWARWRGNDLKPYGKNASFTTECTSCHRPVKNFDYVFTKPLDVYTGILKTIRNNN